MITANDIATAEVNAKKAKEDAALEVRRFVSGSQLVNALGSRAASEELVDSFVDAVLARLDLVNIKLRKEEEDGNACIRSNATSSGETNIHGY